MEIPTKDKSKMFRITDSDYCIVHVTENDKYRVAIRPYIDLAPNEKYSISINDDNSFEFETFEEVIGYILENANEEYKVVINNQYSKE